MNLFNLIETGKSTLSYNNSDLQNKLEVPSHEGKIIFRIVKIWLLTQNRFIFIMWYIIKKIKA